MFENVLFRSVLPHHPMKKLIAILILFSASVAVTAQNPQNGRFMAVDEVRPGMKGIGRTVFEGTAIQDFQVEVMGVLRNVQPKQDLILARLSGGPLDKTGVIQGMSGSPVYINGRLVGAVAFSFPFAKDPIAGIQPIAQMLDLLDRPAPAPVPASTTPDAITPGKTPAAFVFEMMEKARSGARLEEIFGLPAAPVTAGGGALTHIPIPVSIAGATPGVLQQFGPFLGSFGFSLVQSGASGGAANLPSTPSRRLEPGASVNAELVRGDLDVSANGTVTYVDGDKVYAFGHPFLSAGPLNLPMSNAYVISSIARLDSSSKIAVPVEVVGAFRQDRATGIFGSMADKPSMIPMTVRVKSSNGVTTPYRFEVVNDRFLTPLLASLTMINAIGASERGLGEITMNVTGKIQIKGSDPVNISNISTGDGNGPTMATVAAVSPIQYLLTSGFDGALIEGVDVDITTTDRKTSATLERISVNKDEVRPGETITMSAQLRGTRGEIIIEQYPVDIPAGLSGGKIQMMVGDGSTVTASELRRGATGAPPGLAAAVRELNKLRRNDRLYVKITNNQPGVVIGGEELPSLPPSMIALLDTSRASSRGVAALTNSTVVEYELSPSRYVLQGQRSLTLTVKP
ncbi:MAG TPA: SpoIVB peptidase S55 domain-containing protein [Terriglobia bacterium]|nr:SpoIVB peptidase S55 domain-containing protein [Terriglobia bacterium]